MNTQFSKGLESTKPGRFRPKRAIAIGSLGALALVGGTLAVASYADNSSPAASSTAVLDAQPNSVTTAGNPFTLSAPVTGRHSEFGVATFEGTPVESSPAQVKAEIRAAGVLDATDARAFTESRASSIRRADGKFLTKSAYSRDGASVTIESWSPDGPFTLFVPPASPVKEIKQTTIAGHPAVTILTSAAVVGASPPRQVYIEVGGNYYSISAEGLASNQEMLDLTARIVAEVAQPR